MFGNPSQINPAHDFWKLIVKEGSVHSLGLEQLKAGNFNGLGCHGGVPGCSVSKELFINGAIEASSKGEPLGFLYAL